MKRTVRHTIQVQQAQDPVPPKSVKPLAESDLSGFKPDFALGATRFADLRVYLFQGNALQEGEFRLQLFKQAEEVEFRGLRATDTTSWNIDNKTPFPTFKHITFCGDPSGASRFLELAQGAGCCVEEHLPWASEYSATERHFGPHHIWIDSIFRVAWEHRSGIPLRAQKMRGGKIPEGCFCSFLPINPFRASAVLIDVLLSSVGEHLDPSEPAGTPDAVAPDIDSADSPYRPASDICKLFGFSSLKALDGFIDRHEIPCDRPLTKEGKPHPQRKVVHVLRLLEALKKDDQAVDSKKLAAVIESGYSELKLAQSLREACDEAWGK